MGQQIPSLSGCVQPHANLHVVRHRMECGVLEEPSPTSSTLSGQYSNELDYIPNCFDSKQWVETPLHLGFLPVRFTRSPTFNADIVSERIASDVRSLESPLFAQRNLVGDRRRASWRTLRYDLQQSSILTQNYIFRLQPTSAAIFPSAISHQPTPLTSSITQQLLVPRTFTTTRLSRFRHIPPLTFFTCLQVVSYPFVKGIALPSQITLTIGTSRPFYRM